MLQRVNYNNRSGNLSALNRTRSISPLRSSYPQSLSSYRSRVDIQPRNSYLPPQPQSSYLPPHSFYLPPQNSYIPPQNSYLQSQSSYLPAQP